MNFKYLFLSLVLSAVAGMLCASPVSQQQAINVAHRLFQSQGVTRLANAQFYDRAADYDLSNVYFFTPVEGDGFVVIAADDCVQPVIAYSAQSPVATALPPAMRYWLDGVDNQIAYYVSRQVLPTKNIIDAWQRLIHPSKGEPEVCVPVAPLLSTTWNQSAPYNEACPEIHTEFLTDLAYTGCVATAMAQIMRFWKYPLGGMDSNIYMLEGYGKVSANFENTIYSWGLMPNSGASTQDEADALATLLFHCGVSVNMQYGLDASSAYSKDVVYALEHYFGYKSTMQYLTKSDYTDSAWCAMLRQNLDAGMPVFYSGSGPSGGHAFVCDGYNCDGTFHFNWGWGGTGDGFYAIGALNPSGAGIGASTDNTYNLVNSAIFGITPAYSELFLTDTLFNVSRWGEQFSFYVRSSDINNVDWTISSDADWLSFDVDGGISDGFPYPVSVVAAHNTTGAKRSARIVVTQGAISRVITVVQLDGTPSETGCFGSLQDKGKGFTLVKGGEIFIRPEALGNFNLGSVLNTVSFASMAFTSPISSDVYPSRKFRINIYEGSSFSPSDFASSYVRNYESVVGTLVYSQDYTAVDDGEQTVTLATPYYVSNKGFWISVQSLDSCVIMYKEVNHTDTIKFSEYPLFDSMSNVFLRTLPSRVNLVGGGYEMDTILFLASGYDATAVTPEYTVDSAIQYEYDYAISFCVERLRCTDSFAYANTEVCDSLRWFDTLLTTSGVYQHRVLGVTFLGCDSIYELDITVHHSTLDTAVLHNCGSLVTDTFTYAHDSSFVRQYVDRYGCDSVIAVEIYIGHPVTIDSNVVGCDSAFFGSTKFVKSSNSGEVRHSVFGVGCDTTFRLHVSIGYSSHGQLDTTVCDYFYLGGYGFDASNEHAEVRIPNADDCDSIIDVNLTVKYSSFGDTTAISCDSFVWYGNVYDDPDANITHTFVNSVECDSVVSLNLTLRYSTVNDTDIFSCDSFYWDGAMVYENRILVKRLPDANSVGCDSVVNFNLMLHTFSFGDTIAFECDSFAWDGVTFYDTFNVATGHRVNHYGCDSIVTLRLWLNYSTRSHEVAEACGYYMWHGYRVEQLNSEGEFGDTLVNSVGCDSIVVLHLTLHPLCEGGLPGVFMVADDKKVNFSMGNLQYIPNSSLWRFAVRQYDYIGHSNSGASESYSNWIDLFGWGATGYHSSSDKYNVCYQPYSTISKNVNFDYNVNGYGPSSNYICPDLDSLSSNYDWGMFVPVSNGGNVPGLWRTLTADQWYYLINYREKAIAKRAMATVNGIHGMILLPECWTLPDNCSFISGCNNGYLTNLYSPMQWSAMEASGAIFLPAAGARYDTIISAVTNNGYYWSSTHYDQRDAHLLLIEQKRVTVENFDRSVGRSVRLVQDINGESLPCVTYGDTTISCVDSVTWMGNTYYESGEYERRLLLANSSRCDSIVVLHLTVRSHVGIDKASSVSPKVWSIAQTVKVSGVAGMRVRLYDITGRLLADDPASPQDSRSFQVPSAGAYMVKIGENVARKVVVNR